MRFTLGHRIAGAALCVLGFLSFEARADVVFVSSRAALAGTDHVDWGVLGPQNTTVSNPFNISSVDGLDMTVSMPSGSFQRLDQGSSWGGNFAPGDRLLWTAGSPGPITITFDTAVMGAGAQIQQNQFGNFTGTIEAFAFDLMGNSLGSFTRTGSSSGNGDNSAIFLGVRSDTANIGRIVFDVAGTGDFAINQMDLLTGSEVTPVPLPAAAWGGLALFGGMGLNRLRRRKAEVA